jgi:hypothetical protein
MRQFIRVALLLVLLVAAAAQRRAFAPIPRSAPPAGALPSRTGVTPPITPPITNPPITTPTPPIGAVGGWRKPGGWSPAGQEQPAVVAMPYAAPYPVYVDSQDPPADPENPQESPSPTAVAPQPQTTIVLAPTPQPGPAVPNTGLAPCGRAPDSPPALPLARPVPVNDPPSFYIAMNDGWVYIARAYWVENDTLHYITDHGRHNQVSLGLVNREVSMRLNAKRADEFHLPE